METQKHFDKQFSECLSAENSGIQAPPLALMWEARNKVAARKQELMIKPSMLESFVFFIRLHLRSYPLGVSLLLISSGFFYLNEPKYSSVGGSEYSGDQNLISLHTTTISVTSSTLLTSIPTLVIRN